MRRLQNRRIANPQPLAISDASETHAPHDSRKRPVGHLCSLQAGSETGYLKGPSLQPLLVKQETVTVPAKQLHHLAVLAEEDKDIAVQERTVQLVTHNLGQSVDARVHPHIALADVVLPTFL